MIDLMFKVPMVIKDFTASVINLTLSKTHDNKGQINPARQTFTPNIHTPNMVDLLLIVLEKQSKKK